MFRVWDTLIAEGDKVLFRIGLAIFKILESQILQASSMDEVVALVKNDVRNAYTFPCSPAKLMYVAFKGIGNLRRKDIEKLRTEYVLSTQERHHIKPTTLLSSSSPPAPAFSAESPD